MKNPVVDLSECIECMVCREVCPTVFSLNDSGFIAVADCLEYPESEVDEAIKNCPTDCIDWEET
jgi:ferredoxin